MDPNRDSAFGPIPPSRRRPRKHAIHRLPTEVEVRAARLAALGIPTDAEGRILSQVEGPAQTQAEAAARPVAHAHAPDPT
jgi:hypothetical protein